jgi:hypothetical protein
MIVLDSAGYGPFAINKSISIIASPGAYAGISVFSGEAAQAARSAFSVGSGDLPHAANSVHCVRYCRSDDPRHARWQ